MALTRSEFIATLAERFPELSQSLVDRAARVLIEYMAVTVASGGRIEIRDFGAFSVRRYPPAVKRNPKTGEAVMVGARTVVHFRSGKGLRDRVNAPSTQAPRTPT